MLHLFQGTCANGSILFGLSKSQHGSVVRFFPLDLATLGFRKALAASRYLSSGAEAGLALNPSKENRPQDFGGDHQLVREI